MQTITFELKSNGPALMCSDRLSNPLDPLTLELAKITSKRKKVEDDHREICRLKFLGALYHDDELGPYWPASNFYASLLSSARLSKDGKSIERGVVTADSRLRLEYPGPRDREALFADSRFVDIRSAVPQRKRVLACRARFDPWSCKASLFFDAALMDRDLLVHIAERAGDMTRIGTYRQQFGRYTVKVLEG